MATEWEVKATELVNCNCNYGCPCQFNALPTHGDCRAAIGYEIEAGHFGGVKLDGLRAVLMVSWPGPIHHGNGTMQLIVDQRADDAQRDALLKILTGQETDDMATVWWVFSAMSPNKLEPLFRAIEYEVDVEARRGRFRVAGIVETTGEPIRNPVTGAEHRARIDLPNGFEYRTAEMGSATTRASGAIALPGIENSYAQFAHLHLSNRGRLN
ncbi:MAG TPA: DUF1326 domain-containing protein [Stellaceae bacterium]|nr:DUF1326 domain-containing protein [Stellaceae bacterium]